MKEMNRLVNEKKKEEKWEENKNDNQESAHHIIKNIQHQEWRSKKSFQDRFIQFSFLFSDQKIEMRCER